MMVKENDFLFCPCSRPNALGAKVPLAPPASNVGPKWCCFVVARGKRRKSLCTKPKPMFVDVYCLPKPFNQPGGSSICTRKSIQYFARMHPIAKYEYVPFPGAKHEQNLWFSCPMIV